MTSAPPTGAGGDGPATGLTVSALAFCPVKSTAVHQPDELVVDRGGVRGDRAFFIVNERRQMVSARIYGDLLRIRADHDLDAGQLRLTFPDGSACEGEVETGPRQAVTFFGRQAQVLPVGGEFSGRISDFIGADLRLVAKPPGESGVDRGAIGGVTLLGDASVRRLERELAGADGDGGGHIDPRRFRMSVRFSGGSAHLEDDWIGRKVKVGEVTLRVHGHVGRCNIPRRSPDTGERDLQVLDLLQGYRSAVPSEESIPFGVFASVVEPGRIRPGDRVLPI